MAFSTGKLQRASQWLSVFIICIGFAMTTVAQSDSTWSTEVYGTVSVSQVGFWRWYEGGISSLALGTNLSGKATKTSRDVQQEYEARLTFGVVKQDGIELRKSDDLIQLQGAFKFSEISVFGELNPALSVDIRSQFAKGYQYDEKDLTKKGIRISGFLSPAIVTQTIALNYPAKSWLNIRLGMAAKQTIVTIKDLRSRYKVSQDQIIRWQVGSAGHINFERTIFTNVHLKSILTLFLAFNQQSPDSIWETFLTMKVNSWLQVNAEYTALYDRDLATYVQQKQLLTLGVSFKVL
ncbi:MAG: DUF3078 domain-containing protein [Bacteroidetes bacterium]|nr:DUF3078 domain-containing protein [Bacteroidota bacterium]